jgi:exosortase/archaeosortase family protein
MESQEISVKDIVVYFGTLYIFYQFFMIVPSLWIELLTAQLSTWAMNALGFMSEYGVRYGFVWMTLDGGARPVLVYIIRECTAFHVWGIILGLVVPLKNGDWANKITAVLFGGTFIFVMNITRIMLTVYLTGYDVPPFSWFFTNPTVETFHYPVSFAYGVVGIAVVIWLINEYILPELGDFLIALPDAVMYHAKKIVKKD